MFLPEKVTYCMRVLGQAGFEAYAVGGCVRDALLGLTPHDYDLCTNALPSQTAELFAGHTLIRQGEKHGTIGVVVEGEVLEITTVRTEGGYQDSRHPDWVKFVPSLKEDLSRRDFTVNAMAYSPETGYVDPFGGQKDLKNHILRTVGDPELRFTEDALRILRGVRFGVRFGLTPEADTLAAMRKLSPLMDKLAPERVFEELCKLLPLLTAKDLDTYQAVFVQAVPALAACVGFDQRTPYHCYDVYTHTAQVVENIAPDLALRWAALLHDCGKPDTFSLDEQGVGHFYGHAQVSAQKADALLLALKAPTALRERVVFLVDRHMTDLLPDKKLLRKRLGKWGVEAVLALLKLQKADFGGKDTADAVDDISPVEQLIAEILQEHACLTLQDLQVDGRDLMAVGFPAGKLLGSCLAYLLEQVQEEVLPNEKQALLTAAKAFLANTQ